MQKPIHIGTDMRIVHPEYGDMTEDVARELTLLNEKAQEKVYQEVAHRQNLIAKQCGTESVVMRGGMRLVAQIDENIYNYWEQREGRQFWNHELGYMLKKHPELAVTPKSLNPTVGYRGTKVRGKRGRWAL